MIEARYGKIDGKYECLSLSGEGERICFRFPEEGLIRISGELRQTKDGASEFDTGAAFEGEICPIYYTREGSFAAEPIYISGGKASHIPKDDEYVRRLAVRAEELSGRVSALEGQMRELSRAVFGQRIF